VIDLPSTVPVPVVGCVIPSSILIVVLLPAAAREAAFVEVNGSEALERKFDEFKPNYLDPMRPSAV